LDVGDTKRSPTCGGDKLGHPWPHKKHKNMKRGKIMFFPDIETYRLKLRVLNANDTEFIFKHFSNDDVCKYLYDNEPLTSIEEAEKIIRLYESPEVSDHNRWVIVNKEDNVIIGTCGYHYWDKKNNIAEIGYDLEKNYWGKGYMTEAMKTVLNHGFRNLNLNRVQAFVYVENDKSCNLLKRLGFKSEGVIREKHLYRGKYYDHFCFSLLKEEWNKEQM
jgi:ribosomal-protein-alanine N-acetyltransferase